MFGNFRSNCRTASASAFTSADWQSGGAGGLNSSDAVSRIGFQSGKVMLAGLSPTHMQGPVGTVPLQTASEPSAFATAITCSATRRPNSRPAAESLGNWTPARTRDCAASSAIAWNDAASSGKK